MTADDAAVEDLRQVSGGGGYVALNGSEPVVIVKLLVVDWQDSTPGTVALLLGQEALAHTLATMIRLGQDAFGRAPMLAAFASATGIDPKTRDHAVATLDRFSAELRRPGGGRS